jgi:hypothetical protein
MLKIILSNKMSLIEKNSGINLQVHIYF